MRWSGVFVPKLEPSQHASGWRHLFLLFFKSRGREGIKKRKKKNWFRRRQGSIEWGLSACFGFSRFILPQHSRRSVRPLRLERCATSPELVEGAAASILGKLISEGAG